MQITKQTFRNYKPVIIYCVVSIILLVCGTIVASNFLDPLENYQYYRQPLDSAMGGILGILIIITVFYSGKIHDYKKDFLRTNGKLATSLKLLVRRCNHLKSLFKEYEEMYKIHNDLIKIVERCQNISKEREQIIEDVFKNSKPWFNYLCITFITAIIFGSFYYNSEQTVGNFFFQLFVLGIGTSGLMLYWESNERNMKTLHESYKQLLDMLVISQNFIGIVEDWISTSRKE